MIEKINNEKEFDAAMDACAKYCEEHVEEGAAMFCFATLNDTDCTAKVVGHKKGLCELLATTLEREKCVREIWSIASIAYARMRVREQTNNPNVN